MENLGIGSDTGNPPPTTHHSLARGRIVAEARDWIGTPYHHQASVKGVGCDCLGLVRGVWRAVEGLEPEKIPGYSKDWGEARGHEAMVAAGRRHLVEIAPEHALPGDVVVFRIRPRRVARHAGIVTGAQTFVHAQEGAPVCEVVISPWWAKRIAAAFRFPAVASCDAATSEKNGAMTYRYSPFAGRLTPEAL
jgi:NlpC/P60 family putative phage cell wall peptidase